MAVWKMDRKVLPFVRASIEQGSSNEPMPAGMVEQLYRNHWGELCRRLRRMYGDGPPEPEDLAQAAFVQITRLSNADAIENPRAYLFRAAVNIGLNSIGRIQRTRRFIEDALAESGEPLEEISPSRVYEGKEAWSIVERAFDSLSEKQREIVMRCRIKGETYAQISAETGWSQADISRQLNAALAVLQRARAAGEAQER